jgi:hypothetical protein
MMRWHGFGRSALFAALAALGAFPWLTLTAPVLGTARALRLYLVLVTALYVAGLAREGRRSIAAAAGVAALGCVLLTMAHGLGELALGLAVLLGTARSAILYRAGTARALVTEIGLVTTGLLFARFLGGPTLLSITLAIWGFFLVQSLFFLIAGVSARRPAGRHPDPFEEAHRRATAILGGEGV